MIMAEQTKAYRYQRVAGRIENMIREGTLKSGSRIPSLRDMSSLMGVSLNTVREAYSTLEAQYLIEAVPQSGYFVRTLQKELKALPAVDPSRNDPENVSLCRVMSNYQEAGGLDSETQMGVSSLSAGFYPSAQLARILQDVARNSGSLAFDYHMPPGYRPLRDQVARINGEEGTCFQADDVVMTNGCHEAVFMALQVLCKPGDTVAVESPCYFNFFQMLEALNLNVVEIPSVSGDGFSIDTLRFVLETQKISVFFCIPNFSNPLGTCLSLEKKSDLVRLLHEFSVPMIEDDIYGSLYFGNNRPPTCYSLAEKDDVILCSSFSKNLGPGLRTGWIVPGKYREDIIRLKTLLNLGNNSIQELCLARYLEGRSYVKHMKKIRSILGRQMLQARKSIIESFPSGTRVSSPEGGLVFWVTLPGVFDSMELYRQGMKENLFFAPGKLFSLKRDYSSSLRLNGGNWNPKTEEAVRRLGVLAASVASQTL
jgi:DNA-binding transcriptional MocR family regulator